MMPGNFLLPVQDYLQFNGMARIVGGQLLTRPGDILAMTLFMRSAKAGQLFASEFALLGLYTALHQLAQIMDPVHAWLLRPFPALLFRWQRLVSDHSCACTISMMQLVVNAACRPTAPTQAVAIVVSIAAALHASGGQLDYIGCEQRENDLPAWYSGHVKGMVLCSQAEAFEYGSASDYKD